MRAMEEDLARIRDFVDRSILEGKEKLPPEPELAGIVDVTRGRLRTLLKKLEADGLIWRHVGKGTFVGPRVVDPASRGWADGVSIGDIMDARQLLEPPLAAQAAINARPGDIAALDRCMDEMRNATSYAQWHWLDERLHRLIADATHNALLVLQYETLRKHGREKLDGRLEDAFGLNPAPADTTNEHQVIVDAIKSGNPGRAEEAMRTHLAQVRAKLFGMR